MCWLIRKWILRLFLSFKDLPKITRFSSRNYRYLAFSQGDQKQSLPLQFREEALSLERFYLQPLVLLGKSRLERRPELSSLGQYSEEAKLQLSECDWMFIDDCFKKDRSESFYYNKPLWCDLGRIVRFFLQEINVRMAYLYQTFHLSSVYRWEPVSQVC